MKAIFFGLAAGTAHAQPTDLLQAVRQIDIEQSALNTALTELARQTGVQVARFSDRDAADLMLGPLHGAYTVEQALSRLLSGSGLTYRYVNERTVAIVKAAGTVSQGEPARLDAPASVANVAKSDRPHGWLTRFAAFFATCGALSATAPVCAQESAEPLLEEIVVTGSRVIANGNDSPTPVTVVTTEELTAVRPGNLAESLADMPVFTASRGLNTNTGTNGAAGSPATSANAGNVANLRQMGPLRTLVLYDGHRAPPSTPDGYVDLDSIPQMLLKRVDVVTGGASAVYGSDAITGVVNLVTDTTFEGIKGHLQAGRSAYNDADTSEGGIAFGTSLFSGRGHFEGSFETRHMAPIDSKFDRPWGKNVYTLQGSSSNANGNIAIAQKYPLYQVIGARASNVTYGGRVNNTAFGDMQFTSGGYLVPFNHGTKLYGLASDQPNGNCGSCEIGGDGGVYNGQLRAALDMNQFFGRFDFDFTDDVHGYLTAADTLNHSVATGNYVSNATYAISRDNAFLLPQYRTALGTATTFTMGKIWTEIPRGETDTHTKQFFVNAGLQGSLGDYKWDLSLIKSNGSFNVRQNKAIDNGRFYAALDSVVSNGVPVCRASLTNAAYAGCVPLNPFGQNAGSQASIDYFIHPVSYETKIGMEDAAANITGSLFNTWAGPVNAALSAEWRKLTYEIASSTPDPRSTVRANCTGIGAGLGCTGATTVYSSSVATVPEISTQVSEAAVEFGVPLLKDKPFAQSLDLNTAYRFAHYDTAGNANTWKVGFTWDPFDMLTVRATRSRDFRAPSLDENFRAISLSSPNRNFSDALPGNPDSPLNPFASTLNGGNPDLKPELGDTLTYGIVFRPTPNFDIAVDAYDIKVTDAIFLIQGNNPGYQGACYSGGGTSASNPGSSAYCQLIVRDANGSVTQWKQTFINLAEIDTVGADIEIGYRTTIADRPLSLRLLTTYQPHLIYKQPGISPDSDYAGSSFGTNGLQANPVWKATGFVTYKPTDKLTVSLQERWRSSLPKVDGNPTYIYSGSPVKSVAYTNINLSYSPTMKAGNLELFLNVQNLFNTDPPQAGFWGNPTPGQFGEFAFGDDVIGRYYTAGLRFRM